MESCTLPCSFTRDGLGRALELTEAIAPVTWKRVYEPVIREAVELMAGATPATTGSELIQRIVAKWKPGTRRRQQAVDALCQFLNYGVEQHRLAARWNPPISRKILKGVPSKERRTGKAELVVPTDAELLQVIESLRDEAGMLTVDRRRWYPPSQTAARQAVITGGAGAGADRAQRLLRGGGARTGTQRRRH